MSQMPVFLRMILFCLLTLYLPTGGRAQIPHSPDGYSMEDYRREHADFRTRVMVEAYKKHTKDLGAARERAIKFLETYVQQHVKDRLNRRNLRKLSNAAIKAGSSDRCWSAGPFRAGVIF